MKTLIHSGKTYIFFESMSDFMNPKNDFNHYGIYTLGTITKSLFTRSKIYSKKSSLKDFIDYLNIIHPYFPALARNCCIEFEPLQKPNINQLKFNFSYGSFKR